jgi:hypothetical protein
MLITDFQGEYKISPNQRMQPSKVPADERLVAGTGVRNGHEAEVARLNLKVSFPDS